MARTPMPKRSAPGALGMADIPHLADPSVDDPVDLHAGGDGAPAIEELDVAFVDDADELALGDQVYEHELEPLHARPSVDDALCRLVVRQCRARADAVADDGVTDELV